MDTIATSAGLEHISRIAALGTLGERGALSQDIWRKALDQAKKEPLERIQCIKIDAINKSVTLITLQLAVEEDMGEDTLVIRPQGLKEAIELPRGAMIRGSSMPPYGDLLKWTDLECVPDYKSLPGFKIKGAKALIGKALVLQSAEIGTDRGDYRVSIDSTQDEQDWISENITWLSGTEITRVQEEEYQETKQMILAAQEAGLMPGQQVIFMG